MCVCVSGLTWGALAQGVVGVVAGGSLPVAVGGVDVHTRQIGFGFLGAPHTVAQRPVIHPAILPIGLDQSQSEAEKGPEMIRTEFH